MKKCLVLLLLCFMLILSAASAEKASYHGISLDTSVDYVSMSGVKVTNWDSFISFLHKFPNLTRCDMYDTRVHLKEADRLTAEFPNVQFGWTLEILGCDKTHVFRNDITAFSTLHNNRTPLHSSADFEILKYCPNLLALDVGHNAVTDVSFLKYTPNLRVLILACNHITDITPVKELKDLQYLEIFKNQITDISPLAELTNLLDLNICFNRIRNWDPLLGLTNLERLWLYNSNNYAADSPVPNSVVNSLKKALKNTTVDAVSYSTEGGWRDHPRYFIMDNMFKNYSYIPFDQSYYIRKDGKTAEYTHPIN